MFKGIKGIDEVNSSEEDYGRFLIYGRSGTGKSTLASTVAEMGKTLYIDFVGEKGTRSFRGAPYEKNITVVRPQSITALDDLFWKLDSGELDFKAVVIDSLTAVQKMTMRYLLGHDETAVREIQQGASPATFSTWGQSLDVMVDTATFWYGLADGNRDKPMHVVMTSQTKVIEDDAGDVTHTPDVQKGAIPIVLANPDYILFTDTEDNPDYDEDEDGTAPNRHIVLFGSHPGYRTKARVPYNLRGKIPPVLGRKSPITLKKLSSQLGIGGVPKTSTTTTTTTATRKAK